MLAGPKLDRAISAMQEAHISVSEIVRIMDVTPCSDTT